MEKLMEQEAMMEQQDQKVWSRQVLQVGCIHLFFFTAQNLQLCAVLELPRLRRNDPDPEMWSLKVFSFCGES